MAISRGATWYLYNVIFVLCFRCTKKCNPYWPSILSFSSSRCVAAAVLVQEGPSRKTGRVLFIPLTSRAGSGRERRKVPILERGKCEFSDVPYVHCSSLFVLEHIIGRRADNYSFMDQDNWQEANRQEANWRNARCILLGSMHTQSGQEVSPYPEKSPNWEEPWDFEQVNALFVSSGIHTVNTMEPMDTR